MSDTSSPGSPGPPPQTDYDVVAASNPDIQPGNTNYNVVAASNPNIQPGNTNYSVTAASNANIQPGNTNYSVKAASNPNIQPGNTNYSVTAASNANIQPGNTNYSVAAPTAMPTYKDPTDYTSAASPDTFQGENPNAVDNSGGGWKFPGMNPMLLNPVVDTSEFTMYPPISSNFMVAIDGVSCGVWTDMNGLAMEYTGTPWQEGGQVVSDWLLQPRKQQTLTLSRPIGPASMEMLAWFQLYGHIIIPLTAFVAFCDFQGNVCYWWELMGVTPLKWTGPKGKAGASDAAIETLTLTYTDFLAYGPGPGLGAAGAVGAAIGAGVGVAATVGEAVISALTAPSLSAASGSSSGGGALGAISGGLSSLMGSGGITFDIVPKTYTMSQKQTMVAPPVPGAKKSNPPAQFKGASQRTLSFEAIFDCMTFHLTNPLEMVSAFSNGVQPQLDFLWGCLGATPDSIGTPLQLPPLVTFTWGTLTFVGYITSLDVTVGIFRIDGTPMRANVKLALQESPQDTPGQNPTSAANGANKTHTVVAGDSLASIAYSAFGRADYWRAIANLNGIDDPMRVKPGTALLLPKPMDARAIA